MNERNMRFLILTLVLVCGNANALLITYTGEVTETEGNGLGYAVGDMVTGTISIDSVFQLPSEDYFGNVVGSVFSGSPGFDGEFPVGYIPPSSQRFRNELGPNSEGFFARHVAIDSSGVLNMETFFTSTLATIQGSEVSLQSGFGTISAFTTPLPGLIGMSNGFRADVTYSVGVPGPAILLLFAGLFAVFWLRNEGLLRSQKSPSFLRKVAVKP